MYRRVLAVTAALVVAAGLSADTYEVTTTDDAGDGSLRWAINQTNSRAGPDTITFLPALAGNYIRLQTPLPPIRDSRTTIDGDIDADGNPDIELRGSDLTRGHGIQVDANRARIIGLSIVSMPWAGVWIWNAADCTVRACWIGLTVGGADFAPNRRAGIALFNTDRVRIGGTSPVGRNIIVPKHKSSNTAGIEILLSRETTVVGNYIGVKPDGVTAFHDRAHGIRLLGAVVGRRRGRYIEPRSMPSAISSVPECAENVIGGTTPGARNLFGGLKQGIIMVHALRNTIAGNYFGLGSDGNTALRIGQWAMFLGFNSDDNLIGGEEPGAGNVFAAAPMGIWFAGANDDNRVQGNLFGMNAAGTVTKRLRTGVFFYGGGEGCVVGGATEAAGNYFTPKAPGGMTYAISMLLPPPGIVVRYNTIGRRPDGRTGPQYTFGVAIVGGSPRIVDNTIVRAHAGIGAANADPRLPEEHGTFFVAYRNLFRRNNIAVLLDYRARCKLGDLGNEATTDDGGNTFRSDNTWYVRNQTPHPVKAEGNNWDTTVRSEISAKIWDHRDRVTRGRVDFDPLMGGGSPTGLTLSLTGATALSTGKGAEIMFALSSAADVTVEVLNIAGWPVAAVRREALMEAGLQRIVWTGRLDVGTQAPAGRYLVRMRARGEEGQAAQAICLLTLER